MPRRATDLHLHTTCSDGRLTPSELVRRAHERKLRHIAITDHDTVAGIEEAQRVGREVGVEVHAGVELSVTCDGQEIHLLGYFFDSTHPAITNAIERMRRGRIERAREIGRRLEALDVPIDVEAVIEREAESVGRPHLAEEMAEVGHVRSPREAFTEYLHDEGPACAPKPSFPVRDAIAALHEAGGISSLAHPGNWASRELVEAVVEAGVDAIEVVHPSHPRHLVTYYRELAERYDLLCTGGSDYHGRRDEAQNLGTYCISQRWLERALAA